MWGSLLLKLSFVIPAHPCSYEMSFAGTTVKTNFPLYFLKISLLVWFSNSTRMFHRHEDIACMWCLEKNGIGWHYPDEGIWLYGPSICPSKGSSIIILKSGENYRSRLSHYLSMLIADLSFFSPLVEYL